MEAQQACALEERGLGLIVVPSIALLVTGPLRVTVACWGGACRALLPAMLVVVSVVVVGADSQQHVSAEASALYVCALQASLLQQDLVFQLKFARCSLSCDVSLVFDAISQPLAVQHCSKCAVAYSEVLAKSGA